MISSYLYYIHSIPICAPFFTFLHAFESHVRLFVLDEHAHEPSAIYIAQDTRYEKSHFICIIFIVSPIVHRFLRSCMRSTRTHVCSSWTNTHTSLLPEKLRSTQGMQNIIILTPCPIADEEFSFYMCASDACVCSSWTNTHTRPTG